MRIVESISELPHPPVSVGFVPTMGALHAGHLSLMKKARAENDLVVVSIFVNPTQFGKNEDFGKYPRTLDRDASLAESVGADFVFAPSMAEVYQEPSCSIEVRGLSQMWEGAARPGHFNGVATIVAKLFNMVRPTKAYFGLKDLQQCMVIDRLIADLNFPVKLSLEPTIRESDGLAMSSRNAYLTTEARAVAPQIFRELSSCKAAILSGSDISNQLQESTNGLTAAGFLVDYFELVSLPEMQMTRSIEGRASLIVAAKLEGTRLIDNLEVCSRL